MGLDLDVGIERLQPVSRAVDLEIAHVFRGVENLALQVGEGDDIRVHQPNHAHTGRGQIEGRRGAQAAGADDQDAGGLQPLLAGPTDLAQDQVAGVAFDLFRPEAHRRAVS